MNKFTYFNYAPYECTAVEEYLELMGKKGWMLESIGGYFLKFKKIEPKTIKYNVDLFPTKDINVALEYREYCKAAGWEFICATRKIQVFRSLGGETPVEIHTDPREKFNLICKASISEIIAKIILILISLFNLHMFIFSMTANTLASNLGVCVVVITSSIIIFNSGDIISFIIWIIKLKFKQKDNKFIEYNNYKSIRVKNVILQLLLVISFTLMIFDEVYVVLIFVGIYFGVYILDKFLQSKNYSQRVNTTIIILGIIFSAWLIIITLTNTISRSVDEHYYQRELQRTNQLEVFGYLGSDVLLENLITDNSFLASNSLYFFNIGEAEDFHYKIFESKFSGLVGFYGDRILKQCEKYDIDFIEINVGKYKEIKVYKIPQRNEIVFISNNEIIEVSNGIKLLEEETIIENVYKNIISVD